MPYCVVRDMHGFALVRDVVIVYVFIVKAVAAKLEDVGEDYIADGNLCQMKVFGKGLQTLYQVVINLFDPVVGHIDIFE